MNGEVSLEARVEELESRIKQLTETKAYQKGAERLVLEAARRYGLMATFGKSVNANGGTVSYNPIDVERLTKQFAESLLDYAEELILEDTLAGAPQ